MSEGILKALMQLFAIIATPNHSDDDRKHIVETFLNQELNNELIEEYLRFYESLYQLHQAKQTNDSKRKKVTAASSVKVLMICTVINQELTQKQKFIVLVRLLEFINTEKGITDQEMEFVTTVAETFNIAKSDFDNLKEFILLSNKKVPNTKNILLIDSDYGFQHENIKHIYSENFKGQIVIYQIVSVNIYLFIYHGDSELYLTGQLISPERIYVFSQGASIRHTKIKPIYYSDIISTYNFDRTRSRIIFEVNKLEYKFKNGKVGLYNLSFIERSGKLIGIMGASGAGKSTLLNVLNGSLRPTSGEVLINGINIHTESEQLEGLIGYVSQDDLLIEELTVFQNLYYNAKLCFDHYTHFQLYRTVLKMLRNLGLYEIKDMRVGNPLNKKISGGQRKRLNIALELIREPAILFLDEPTSGLSSRDSENILDLLKELTLKGKLVFVVIHQPSSDIFKMFDKLLILDTGGFLIYNGDPVESIVYFKSRTRQANWSDSECPVCGNVNPEQVFNIVESRVIDEYGSLTQTRKITPKEWSEFFFNYARSESKRSFLVKKLPEINFKVPSHLKQFRVFIQRDVLAKMGNSQYVLINLLEAPILALILSFIIKFYNVSTENIHGYSLLNNSNLPVYIFMSVIVALFIGLTVSAQEIIKDRKILKREAFLNLSKSSYLLSKVAILLILSAFQSFTFVIIGNSILEIKGMFWQYWIVLFTTWSLANMLGLNISDAFKTSITIYILIPFLIIPQILLSGVLVKFDKLNPLISSPSKIPIYGEMITSRWAYEALAVNQFINNKYSQPLYEFDKQMNYANTKRDFWLKMLENKINNYERNKNIDIKKSHIREDFELLRNELSNEIIKNPNVKFDININNIYPEKVTKETIDSLNQYFAALKQYYIQLFKVANKNRDDYVRSQQQTDTEKENFLKLKRDYYNEAIAEFVTNSNETDRVVEYKGRLYQKTQPIYLEPESNMVRAHFYAPFKKVFGYPVSTFWLNVIIIWLQFIMMYIALYYSLLRRILEFSEHISRIMNYRKEKKLARKQQSNIAPEESIKKVRKRKKHRSFFDLKIWR